MVDGRRKSSIDTTNKTVEGAASAGNVSWHAKEKEEIANVYRRMNKRPNTEGCLPIGMQ